MKRAALLALLLAGCDLFQDATPLAPGLDAGADARVGSIDASDIDAAIIDAAPGTPDARIFDAAPGSPDARVFDASVPDAPGTGFPAPRTDVVPPLGSAATFDVAAWNIRNLGTTNLGQQLTDVAMVADLIASLDLDLIAVEEIASIDAWNELVARLPDHEAVLSSHQYNATEYQKIGFLYRSRVLRVDDVDLLFTGDFDFPRPPLAVRFTYDDGVRAPLTFDAIGVHLKAGRETADYDRRRAAITKLDTHLRAQVDGGGENEVVVLGDYNDVLDTAAGRQTFASLLAAPDRYSIRTQAASDAGLVSFIPSGVILDHVTTTSGLADEAGSAVVRIPRLDRDPDVTTYRGNVSDHLPVVISLPLRPR